MHSSPGQSPQRCTVDASKEAPDSAISIDTSVPKGFLGSKAKLHALSILMGLESKPLPAGLSLDQMDPKHCPRLSCFDLEGWPDRCGWQAWNKCKRCEALLDLARTTPEEKSCAIVRAQVGAAFHTTQCESELVSNTSKASGLPLHVLDLVLQGAIDEMRASKDGSIICALMHTNSIIRAKIVQAFEPVGVFERSPCALQQDHEVCWSRHLLMYIWDAIEILCACDFSLRRQGMVKSLVEPTCFDVIDTTTGLQPTIVDFEVMIWSDEPDSNNTMKKQLPMGPSVGRVKGDPSKPITVWDVCWALREALEKSWPGLRMLSPYQRALNGSFEASPTGAYIQVIALLQHLGGREDAHVGRAWRFSTRPLGKAAK